MKPTYSVNDRIRAKQVRLIGPQGEQLGVVSLADALNRAYNVGLDLIETVNAAVPPVCKIADYGKFKYELTQAEKEKARKSRAALVETKIVQLRPITDTHDLQTKAKKAREFLADSDRVKITLRFRGREMAHKDIGVKTMNQFLELVGEHAVVQPLLLVDKNMQITIGPNK